MYRDIVIGEISLLNSVEKCHQLYKAALDTSQKILPTYCYKLQHTLKRNFKKVAFTKSQQGQIQGDGGMHSPPAVLNNV